ncbi:MAG: DUF4097 family beta strand repeat-containing protein [Thermoanaerobaculia bacterium]
MNSRSRRFYFLIAPLLLAACVPGKQTQETITRQWPAAGINRIEIREVDGNVSVEAGPASEISLVANVQARGFEPKKNAENHGYFQTVIAGDTLRIGREHEHMVVRIPFFGRNDVTVNYTLRVPQTVALDLRTVNGRIATRGVNAATDATTVNGPIDLETSGAGVISARTVNGRVVAKFLKTFQGAKLKTVNGSVEAQLPSTASFACDLSQVNGDFEASFPVSIHSHPGSRRVSGEVNGGQYSLKIVTVNGDIQLANSPAAPAAPSSPSSPSAPAGPLAPAAPSAAPAAPAPPST